MVVIILVSAVAVTNIFVFCSTPGCVCCRCCHHCRGFQKRDFADTFKSVREALKTRVHLWGKDVPMVRDSTLVVAPG